MQASGRLTSSPTRRITTRWTGTGTRSGRRGPASASLRSSVWFNKCWCATWAAGMCIAAACSWLVCDMHALHDLHVGLIVRTCVTNGIPDGTQRSALRPCWVDALPPFGVTDTHLHAKRTHMQSQRLQRQHPLHADACRWLQVLCCVRAAHIDAPPQRRWPPRGHVLTAFPTYARAP
jgi:hypothetical protein